MNFLFAIDEKTQEVNVSESLKGTTKINFVERVARTDNEILYNAVLTLTSMSRAADLDMKLFKAMDKVCQGIYAKHKPIQ
ncbi:MAG: hypothetical protein ACKO5C_02020 [Ferruginibacter sp.]